MPLDNASTLELGNVQRSSVLRKTHSQPQPTKAVTLLLTSSGEDQAALEAAQKHLRCKSVPNPLHVTLSEPTVKGKKGTAAAMFPSALVSDQTPPPTEPPSSPQDGATGLGSTSPKPKRNFLEGVKNTLRPKSKSGDKVSTSGKPTTAAAAAAAAAGSVALGNPPSNNASQKVQPCGHVPVTDNYATVSQASCKSVSSTGDQAGDNTVDLREMDSDSRSPSDKAHS